MTHPFAEGTLTVAQRYLDNAIALLEEHADMDAATRDPTLLGQAYAQLLRARGAYHAVAQIEQIHRDLERADTERPSSLRLVKP